MSIYAVCVLEALKIVKVAFNGQNQEINLKRRFELKRKNFLSNRIPIIKAKKCERMNFEGNEFQISSLPKITFSN